MPLVRPSVAAVQAVWGDDVMTWAHARTPDHPGLYAIIVGAGTPVLATWNARDGRWFNGYQKVDPQYVRAYCPIPVYEGEREWNC